MSRVRVSRAWREEFAKDAVAALDHIGADMVSDAVALVPVDTGALRASITHEVDVIDGQPVLRISAGDDDEVTYAAYVELGTRRMVPEPYLRPAVLKIR